MYIVHSLLPSSFSHSLFSPPNPPFTPMERGDMSKNPRRVEENMPLFHPPLSLFFRVHALSDLHTFISCTTDTILLSSSSVVFSMPPITHVCLSRCPYFFFSLIYKCTFCVDGACSLSSVHHSNASQSRASVSSCM